ncbi:MAG: hypothetical protein HYV45_01005 [Candidatus Moranbacteria bacterium]|nr:hypothetical protein [Candidatus Moranbacteria bacterium]
MSRKEKQHRQKQFLRRLFRLHLVLTAIFLGGYFSVVLFDPGFFSYDIRQKYRLFADDIVVSAVVLGPPATPVVTATSICNTSTGTLSVSLDWADDPNTYTYDIDRDSLPLVSGLSASSYSDTTVSLATTYSYVVTANGPMGPGFAASAPVSVTTHSECEITAPTPTVTITSFDGSSVGSYDGMPRVSHRRPKFAGTTNIPNATIQVVVGPLSSIAIQFSANANGYWEWRPTSGLPTGTQTFTVTAIDPLDNARQASTSLQFGIKKRDDEGGGGSTPLIVTTPSKGGISEKPATAPLDFSLSIENENDEVLQGGEIRSRIVIKKVVQQYDGQTVPIRYRFLDKQGNTIRSFLHEGKLKRGQIIEETFAVPLYVASGAYSLQAEIMLDDIIVSRMNGFLIIELPLVQLGGGVTISYAEIMHQFGWISLLLLLSFLLWIFMFLREYWMYLHAFRHVAEEQLKKAGFLTRKRKGVAR